MVEKGFLNLIGILIMLLGLLFVSSSTKPQVEFNDLIFFHQSSLYAAAQIFMSNITDLQSCSYNVPNQSILKQGNIQCSLNWQQASGQLQLTSDCRKIGIISARYKKSYFITPQCQGGVPQFPKIVPLPSGSI